MLSRQKQGIKIICVFLWLSCPSLQAQVAPEWVARYNGPTTEFTFAKAQVIDDQGNTYVTGQTRYFTTGYDYATVKYDSDGNELWVARYDGPISANDIAHTIAVDADGNVYVSGQSVSNETSYDFATIKYDSNGNELWVNRYDGTGPGAGHDIATGLIVDANGDIYVTGSSWGGNSASNYVTIKYSSLGSILWVARHSRLTSFALDASNNVYLTGDSYGTDYVTVKYNNLGVKVWEVRYNGVGNGLDVAHDITTDANGDIYVTGQSSGPNGSDYVTIKYDNGGNQLWLNSYDGPEHLEDIPGIVTTDINGNVYVTGYSRGSVQNELVTIQYDASGNEQWIARHPTNLYRGPEALSIDGNNTYLVASSSNPSGNDYTTIKYDSNGNELWVEIYDGPDNSSDDPVAVSSDSNGNVYVTGSSHADGASDYATVKYDSTGSSLWVARYEGYFRSADIANDIEVDADGNVYITGQSGNGINENDYTTFKYDKYGNVQWLAFYNGPQNRGDTAEALAVDDNGNVYVTGSSSNGSISGNDIVTVKYDASGNEVWVIRYQGPGISYDAGIAIKLDASANVYVTGTSAGSNGAADYMTIKYDNNGNQLWESRYNGIDNSYDTPFDLIVDANGNAYVTGRSLNFSSYYDYTTIKYDSNGNELWVVHYNGLGGSSLDTGEVLALDTNGNVYVSGTSANNYATIKYDANGNEIWVIRYSNFAISNVNDMAVDTNDNVYVTGGSRNSSTGTGYDYVTLKYDQNGNEIWKAVYNGPENGSDIAETLIVDGVGNVLVAGRSFSTTGFDYATVKYDSAGDERWLARYNGPGDNIDVPTDIVLDLEGNAYITGYSAGLGTTYDMATLKYTRDFDSDGDGIPDDQDECGFEDASGFDIDMNGCIDSIVELSTLVTGLSDSIVPEQMATSLLLKVENADRLVDKDHLCAAINQLEALILQVEAQTGGNISEEAATAVINFTNSAISYYNSQLSEGDSCF
jgi:uncharacterized delta-60 repeat protein